MEKIDGLDVLRATVDDAYSDGENLGIDKIAHTKLPAVLQKGVAYSAQHNPKEMIFTSNPKMRIAAPLMIPMNIYRNDDWGEYYVQFTAEEIEKLYMKFMKNLKNQELYNDEHDTTVSPSYLLETILCDTPKKLKYIKDEYNINLPIGSVFIVSQVTDANYYNQLVTNEQTGFSIEGFLGFKMSEIIKNKKNTSMAEEIKLPTGEHTIGDKIYVVDEAGNIVEIKDVIKTELEAEVKVEEEIKETEMEAEVKVEEEVKETELEVEAEVKEEVKETELQIDETELMAILQPKFDEIYKMIADLKASNESTEEVEIEEIPVAMSAQEKRLKFAESLATLRK